MASKETEPSTLLNTKLKIKTEELFTKEIKPVEVFIREGKTEDFIREGKTEEDFIKESKTEDNIEYIAEEDTGNKAKKPVQTKTKKNATATKRKKPNTTKNAKKSKPTEESDYDPTKLEYSSDEVSARFNRGCECQDESCFKGLNPETVYRHRLNIAELTKAEHDMYLMGLTMACLTNPYETARHTERRRLRAQYVYQGRKVCLEAFLYLENCTHYQVKRIRKHLMTHGVTPRVHGNHGKVPHNTFSLDIYQNATEFLKDFVKKQEESLKTKLAKNAPLHLSADVTRKAVHDMYLKYCKSITPNIKALGYSTFRRFMSEQFSQIKFAKQDFLVRVQTGKNEVEKNEIYDYGEEVNSANINLMQLVMASEAVSENDTYILTQVTK